MKRLVYSPYVQAYVNADDGVIDISPYLVRGSIDRKINQVSSAELVLRNPVQGSSSNLLFTEYTGTDGTAAPHPMFHPMDPIIIVMTRIQGSPIQVFTGFIDTAPYLQLYPGVCKIEASCTLKRLLYTQWDPSLLTVTNFLSQFGWDFNGSGIQNPGADGQHITGNGTGTLQGQFTDGSLGGLLYAILHVIGAWDDSTIWIEALPPQIQTIVTSLYAQLQPAIADSEVQWRSLVTQLLGTGSQGSGNPGTSPGGGSVSSSLLSANQNTFASVLSKATGLDPNVVAAWVHAEEPASASQAPNGANNWLNIGAYDAGNWATGGDPNWSSPTTGGQHSADFLSGAWGGASSGIKAILKSAGQSPQTQISAIQNSGWASSGYPTLPSIYSAIVQAGGNSTQSQSTSSANAPNASSAPADTVNIPIVGAKLSKSGKSPGGKQGNTSNPNTQATGNLAGVASVAQQCLTRQQTSKCFNYSQQRPITYDILTGNPVNIDCSGFAIACYKAAGLQDPSHNNYNGSGYTGDMITSCTKVDASSALPGDLCFFGSSESATEHVNVYVGNGQSISMGEQGDPSIGPAPQMGPSGFLGYYRSDVAGKPAAAGSTSTSTNSAMAAAFSTLLELPGIFSQAEATLLTGKRAFIADSPLFPFIDQVAKASMRSYMSMPNGNFFAFFPDYFGFFGRQFYWEVRDIEIMDARIDLSDDALLTHMGVAGDVTQYPSGQVNLSDLVQTAGVFDIFDAIATGYVGTGSGQNPNPGGINPNAVETERTKEAAVAFLQKYGARPFVEEVPAIRSPFYELFLAFQNFMIAWSKQFVTTIELTFMPELFPGGLIALPDHHLQVYVEEVVHNFDYTAGFTTTASISSPSQLQGDPLSRANLSQGNARPAALTAQGLQIDGTAKAQQLEKELH